MPNSLLLRYVVVALVYLGLQYALWRLGVPRRWAWVLSFALVLGVGAVVQFGLGVSSYL